MHLCAKFKNVYSSKYKAQTSRHSPHLIRLIKYWLSVINQEWVSLSLSNDIFVSRHLFCRSYKNVIFTLKSLSKTIHFILYNCTSILISKQAFYCFLRLPIVCFEIQLYWLLYQQAGEVEGHFAPDGRGGRKSRF